ncbi:PQQ-binding-like beta-propeller repeat protein [Actinoplanes sp. M2I2]|uniref:outer membrane protein assembly factor BamB family protein n=1 Tax=Actinoplanes sp. M2I2 TaxID=1734444 RepID=UPI0020227C09|nr:PQQ-binding-like beta-propeller repeat protein [Actinoplanes sp. M2I2]
MTIDLDVAPAIPTRDGRRRTRWDVLAVAVLVLVLATASAPPPPRSDLSAVLEGDGRGITASLLTRTALFTQHEPAAGSTSDIWARPVRPGGPEWITQVPAAGSGLWLDETGTVLVNETGDAGQATFLDVRTGRIRWRTTDYATVRSLGARVTDWRPAPPSPVGTLRIRDVATGRLVWSRPAAGFVVDDAHRYVVTLDGRRRATVLAAADGRVLAGPRDLDVAWGVEFAPPSVAAQVIADRLVVFGTAFVAAFRIADLAPLWRTTTAQPFAVAGCGEQICALSSGGLAVLDPGTGTVRWTSSRWRGLADDGTTLLDQTGRSARVDLATGRIEDDLGGGSVVAGLQVVDDGDARTLIRRIADGRVLGVIPRVPPGSCTAAADLLACRTLDARFRVWRLPPGAD